MQTVTNTRFLGDVAISTNELINRFNFDMRVMMEFVSILVKPPPPCCPEIAEAVSSIQKGIMVLVDHAGLEQAPSVVDYMTEKIWGRSDDE